MIAVRTITETAVCRTLHFVLDMFACTLRGSMIGLFGGTKHPVPLTKSALLILVNVLAEFFARCSFDGSLSQEVLSHNLHKEVITVTQVLTFRSFIHCHSFVRFIMPLQIQQEQHKGFTEYRIK